MGAQLDVHPQMVKPAAREGQLDVHPLKTLKLPEIDGVGTREQEERDPSARKANSQTSC